MRGVEMEKKDTGKYILQSVDNALRIVELLTHWEELSYAELAEKLGLSKSAVFRLVATLEHHRMIVHSDPSRIRLSFKIAAMGGIVYNRSELLRAIHPHLVDITQRTGYTSHLVVMTDPPRIHFLDKVLPHAATIPTVSYIGYTCLAHLTATGKAILAHRDERALEAYLAAASLDALRAELGRIRAHGYAVNREESEPGMAAFAAPILDDAQTPIAAISICGYRDAMYAQEQTLSQAIMDTAQRICREIS